MHIILANWFHCYEHQKRKSKPKYYIHIYFDVITMTLQQRLALTIKIFSCRSRNPCWKVLPQGNPIIWEGSTPEGWFFLKNSWEDVPEKWKWKVKVRCLQIICLFLSRIWFFYQLVGKCDQGNTPKHVICQNLNKFTK